MIGWRVAIVAVLATLLVTPLAMPVVQLLGEPGAWRVWSDTSRLTSLASNSLLLVLGALALCLPTGTLAALLFYRTDLPGRRLLRVGVILTLFIPLPLFTSGWQAAIGSGGWLPLSWWNVTRTSDSAFAPGPIPWSPWGRGLSSAMWIHAVAGLPWVVWLVGLGLRSVERELEEEALLATGPWRVVLLVTLPRAGAAIVAAAVWVALQTVAEISVTDVMQVRTFAEEVYAQWVVPEIDGSTDGLTRALALALPVSAFTACILLVLAWRWERVTPPLHSVSARPHTFSLGRWRWPFALIVFALTASLIAVPVGSLVWRGGISGGPPTWSIATLAHAISGVLRSSRGALTSSLLVAGGAGLVAAALALLSAWAVQHWRLGRILLAVLVAWTWSVPGPVVGLGLKQTIDRLLDWTGPGIVADALWYGPSFVPVFWIDVIRYFPAAVAVLWPALQRVPVELRESARVDGAGPTRELLLIVAPMLASAWVRAMLATGVLGLGEVSAGKLVATADAETWAQQVFTQMHYGITNDLAARCLLLLALVATVGSILAYFSNRSEPQAE